jgi:hypothetical protein
MRLTAFLSRHSIILTLALLLLTVPAWADPPSERATLKGITAVTVVVEDVETGAERSGFTTSQLQADVELRLRLAGIIVRPTSEGTLYVNATIVKAKTHPLYAFKIQVQYRQGVVLSRAPEISAVATT